MPTQTGFAPILGTRIYYETAGSGPAVVLVHAGIADSRMWDDQFADLSRDFTVVRSDLRGFGRSPMAAGPYAHHRDLAALIEHLSLARPALVGCSLGGRTVLDFALEHPERTAALILVASAVGGLELNLEPPPQWKMVEAAYDRGDLELASEYEVQIWIDGPQRRSDQVPAHLRDKVRAMNLIALQTPEDLGQEQPLDPPAAGRLSEIKAPVLIVTGELDQPAALERSAFLERSLPHTETARLPAAHLPNLELPAEFNRLVRDFLKRSLIPLE